MNALRQCCHAKIQGLQQATADQLLTIKVLLQTRSNALVPILACTHLHAKQCLNFCTLSYFCRHTFSRIVNWHSIHSTRSARGYCGAASYVLQGFLGMQQSADGKLQEAVSKAQQLSQELQTAQSLVNTLRVSLAAAVSSSTMAEIEVSGLRELLEAGKSAAASAQDRVQRCESELSQLREEMQEQLSASTAAIAKMEARITDMGSTNMMQQDEIAALHATIQVCALSLAQCGMHRSPPGCANQQTACAKTPTGCFHLL